MKLENRLDEILQEKISKDEAPPYPGRDRDHLFKPDYPHKHYDKKLSCCKGKHSCVDARSDFCTGTECNTLQLVKRKRLRPEGPPPKPALHFGTVACGDRVMKSGAKRDEIARRNNIIAFEMEGAGVWYRDWDVVVIKGIADYADSHKNKEWQRYCAYTGAAAFKAFLEEWQSPSRRNLQKPRPDMDANKPTCE